VAARVIRIRLSCRGRVEYFDLEGDTVLGRGEQADLSIDHPSIAAQHARVLVRRGRLILAELGGLVGVKGDLLRAATTLRDGETFRLGDIAATAWVMPPSCAGRSIGEIALGGERDAFAVGTRRYEATLHGRRFEVAVLDRGTFEDHEIEAWRTRIAKSDSFTLDGCVAIAERVPLGIRLAQVIESVDGDRISVSPELTLAVVRRVAEALAIHHDASGPHAAVVPGAVQLTLDGDVVVLRPGPRPMDPIRDVAWCSERRRMNLIPSIGDDAFALSRLAAALGGERVARELPEPEEIRTRAAFTDWAARLVAVADRWRLDPSAAHIARVVRLLSDRGRPLARMVRKSLAISAPSH
jgi:hypothetical protein